MRRHAVALIALVLLAIGSALWLWAPDSNGPMEMAQMACVKIGILMAIVWVAYRDVERLPRWLLVLFPLMLALAAFQPRRFVFLLPLVLALLFFRPRGPKR